MFGVTSPQFFGDSAGELKWSRVAANKCAAQLVSPGVISAMFLDIGYSSLSLGKLDESIEDWPNSGTIVEEERLLLGILLGSMTDNHQRLVQYLSSTYLRLGSWYWVE